MITTLRRRSLEVATLTVVSLLCALVLAACGSSSKTDTTVGATVGASTTSVAGGSTTAASSTSLMPTCDGLADPKVITTAVGVPVAPGQVNGAGTCQYLGLNDQSKSVTLSKLVDAGDQANWNDLQTSLGAPTPYTDPALPGALLGADGTLYLTSNGAIYGAQVNVTGGAAKDQAPQAAALLKAWLAT
jgi:hypothetical protein